MLRTGCLLLALAAMTLAQGVPSLISEKEEGPPTTEAPPTRADASYWLVCSNKIRRGTKYVCLAKILAGSSPVDITIRLYNQEGDQVFPDPESVAVATTVTPGDSQAIELDIPIDLPPPGERRWQRIYRMTVVGEGSEVRFKEETRVNLQEKSYSIFIQSDKAIYKFGQFVQFRVLVTTMDLKPVTGEPMDIVIEDPKGNRIWQRLGVTDHNGYGVIDDLYFRIPERAPTGQWTIKVTTLGTTETKQIEVDNYVLPRFEVEIITPPFGVVYDPLLELTVKATYTFNQPVAGGFATLRLSLPHYYYYGRNVALTERGKLDENGEMKVKFSRSQLLLFVGSKYNSGITSLRGYGFQIEANVTEENTERMQGAQASIQYYMSPLNMQFMPISPDNYKPGLEYRALVELKRWDDTLFPPKEMSQITVRFNVTYGRPIKTTTSAPTTTAMPPTPGDTNKTIAKPDMPTFSDSFWYPHRVPEEMAILPLAQPVQTAPVTGWIPLAFSVPDDATWVRIEAQCESPFEGVRTTKYLSKSWSPTNSYLQLSVDAVDRPKVGDTITVKARSTTAINEFSYQVYTKGMLYADETVRTAAPANDFEFQVYLDKMAAPSIRIVCFYLRDGNDEFVVDALSLNVDGIFEKDVSVQFSKEKVEPGEEVDVIVGAEPNSLVFLLANDKSVQLLKSGNDLTRDMVRQDLMSYDYGGYFPWMGYMFRCGWPSYFGGSDARSVFASASVLVMTDALVYSHSYGYHDSYYGYGDDRFLMESVPGAPAPPPPAPPSMSPSDSSADKLGSDESFSQAETVRKFFPENFLWQTEMVGSNGQAVISTTAPDTITSWFTTAFSMHPSFGLSIAEEPVELITFRDLFVTLDLPLSITRGEEYCFTASVFNYYPDPLLVMLTLDKSEDFEVLYLRRDGQQIDLAGVQGYYSHVLGELVESEVGSAMFCIRPLKVGQVDLKVSALTTVQGLSDAVQRTIKVKAEGVPRATSMAYLIDLSEGPWAQQVDISFPPQTVPGSQHITFGTAGNVLGSALDNIDDLLRMPYGCGEQNMLNFAPTVFLTRYYFETGTNDTEKIDRAKEYMMAGVTKELLYEHGLTGAFSGFGNRDTKENGSLWLTSFVLKTFAQGEQLNAFQEVFDIDHRIMERSVDWISRQIDEDGRFVEYGKVFNKGMQGGSAQGEALTAYTALALVEAQKVFTGPEDTRVRSVIQASLKQAVNFLERRLQSISDPYDVCIVGYTLQVTGSKMADDAFNLAEYLVDDTTVGLRFWARPAPIQRSRYYWSRGQDAINIEATAYCLLMYIERGIATSQGLPVLRWLTNQRGPNGGFISTQDTVVGLQALARMSAVMHSDKDIPMTVTLTYMNATQQVQENLYINKNTELLLQKVAIPYQSGTPTSLSLSAQNDTELVGPTGVMATVVLHYNVDDGADTVTYETSHRMTFSQNGFELRIFIKTTEEEPASMTILEVDIPPGFTPDLEALSYSRFISQSELSADLETLVIYFNTDVVTRKGVYVNILMDAPNFGALVSPKDKSYTVTNYYQPDEQITRMYSLDENKGVCEMARRFSFCPLWEQQWVIAE